MNTTYVLDENDVEDRDGRMCHLTEIRGTFDEDGELVGRITYKAEYEDGFIKSEIDWNRIEESLISYGTPYEHGPEMYN